MHVFTENLRHEAAHLLPLGLVGLLDTLVQLKYLHHLSAMDPAICSVASWPDRVDKEALVLLPLHHKTSHKDLLLRIRCLNLHRVSNKARLLPLKLLSSRAAIPRHLRQMDTAPKVRHQQPHQVLESLASTRDQVARLPLNSINKFHILIQEVRHRLAIPLLTTVVLTLQV